LHQKQAPNQTQNKDCHVSLLAPEER
jgi:hypothetical protein